MIRIASAGGVTLVALDHGPPELPPAVIAHGVGSSPRFIREAFAAPLAAAGYRLVAYHLRGHGDSTPLPDPADHDLDRHVADLDAVAAAVGARLVGGVSLGAHIAATWAADREDLDGVLLCLPAWTGRATPGVGPHAAVADTVRRGGLTALVATVRQDPSLPDWLRDLLLRDWATHPADSLVAALIALDGGQAPDAETLRRIRVPAGVVGWPEDPGHPLEVARAWAEQLPRAALRCTSLDAVGAGRTALGAAAVRALLDVVG